MRRSVATTVLCIVPALVTGAVLLVACEDGPNQTYSPATGTLFNTGDVDGAYDPVEAGFDGNYSGQTALQICTADIKRARWAQMLDEVMVPPALFGGIDLRGCGATEAAQLDPKNACEWPGLTIETAEKLPTKSPDGGLQGGNCQGVAAGFGGCAENPNDSCGAVVWGDNGELTFWYDSGTHIIDQLDIRLGYTGKMTWQGVTPMDPGCGGKAWASNPPANYSLELGYPILKNGASFTIPWGTGTPEQTAVAELYDSMAKTFYPNQGGQWPGCTPQNCQGSGTCLDLTNDGSGTGIFGVRPVATYFQFNSTVGQPAASVPYGIYIDYAKFVPNSTQDMTLALNQQGPFTNSVVASGAPGPCQQQIGESFADYVQNCIQPYPGGPTSPLNATNYNKMIGGHAHNLEEVTFNLVGINQDFSLSSGKLDNSPLPMGSKLGTYGVADDTTIPQPGDLSTEWYFDVRAFGIANNEVDGQTFLGGPGAGTGLVAREYQRLVEMDLTRLYNEQHSKDPSFTPLQPSNPGDCEFASVPVLVGNALCRDSTGQSLAGGCPQAPVPVAGHLCTGFEGMVVPGQATYINNGDPKGRSYWLDSVGFAGSVLKPGDHFLAFSENPTAFQTCAGACGISHTYVYSGYDFGPWWDESLAWVVRVMGKGDINNLPPSAADRRFFFKWFGVAMIKYLKAYGDVLAGTINPPGCNNAADPTNHACLNPNVVAAEPIDLETLFFDNSFGASFDKFEYIDLSTVAGYGPNQTQPNANQPYLQVPFDYEYGTDVKIANQRYANWYKRLDREEIALYQALSPVKSDPPASHANYGVNLTNMFGSPVLVQAFKNYECAAAVWANGQWNPDPEGQFPQAASHCSTTYPGGPPNWLLDLQNDPSGGTGLMDLNGQQAALEASVGSPANVQGAYHAAVLAGNSTQPGQAHSLLWQYPAVWGGQTILSQGHSAIQVCPPGATNCGDPKQKTSLTSVALAAAQTVVPSFKLPWAACSQSTPGTKNGSGCDPTDPTYLDQNIFSFVPWTPSQPGVGFSIPVNGSSNLMVQSAQLDFTGNLETYTVDYQPWKDPTHQSCAYSANSCNKGFTCVNNACVAQDNTIEIMAIEAHDFLGEVFPCEDPTTGDVLHVRMYTSVNDILQWLTDHPGDPFNASAGTPSAQTSCGIIVGYSIFDNYPDAVTSLAYGVTVFTNQGAGFGRVVDATVFNPAYETITQ
jgi:hypothetical protein